MAVMMRSSLFLMVTVCLLNTTTVTAQSTSTALDTNQLYNLALQGRVDKAINFIQTTVPSDSASAKVANKFKARFLDAAPYVLTKDPQLAELLAIYVVYWRNTLLKPDAAKQYEAELIRSINGFLDKVGAPDSDKQFNLRMQTYLASKGYRSAVGQTAGIWDFLVWKTEREVNYKLELPEGISDTKIVFLEDVLSMGWEEYATFGKYYPGGWAAPDRLYCVGKAYDLKSENFEVSYLKHEGQHFLDYKLFPGMQSADLEYRAKLVELIYSKTTTARLLLSFQRRGANNPRNSHAFASYKVIEGYNQVDEGVLKASSMNTEKVKEVAMRLLRMDSERRKGDKGYSILK